MIMKMVLLTNRCFSSAARTRAFWGHALVRQLETVRLCGGKCFVFPLCKRKSALFMLRSQKPFLINFFHFIIWKTDVQPYGIRQLHYFFYHSLTKFRMCHQIVYPKFDFAVSGTLVGLFTAVSVTYMHCFVMDRFFSTLS